MIDLFEVSDGEVLMGTYAIAKKLNRRPSEMVRIVDKYSDLMKSQRKDGVIECRYVRRSRSGSETKEYLLNEDQCYLLSSFLRNTRKVLDFKVDMIKSHFFYRDFIEAQAEIVSNDITYGIDNSLSSSEIKASINSKIKRLVKLIGKSDIIDKLMIEID